MAGKDGKDGKKSAIVVGELVLSFCVSPCHEGGVGRPAVGESGGLVMRVHLLDCEVDG